MKDDNRPFDENEGAADEPVELDGLQVERFPSAALKRRTIEELHERGLVRSKRALAPRTIAALAAAASVVFAAGAFVGYATASRRVAPHIVEPVATTNAVVARVDSVTPPSRATKQVVWF